MSQPSARTSDARSTPLCVTRTWSDPLAAMSRRQPASRSATSRGLSPPGGRKSRPAPSRSRMPWPSSARSSVSVRPSKLPQAISASRASSAGSPNPIRAAVSRARASGLVTQAAPAKPCGSRQERTCARPEIAQRDVGLTLDASGLVPARAAVADQADAHAGIRRSASAAASRARAGPRSCRASTRACAARTHGAPPRRVEQERRGPRPRRPWASAARPAARWPRPRRRRPHRPRGRRPPARQPPAPPAAPCRRPRCRPARHTGRRRRRPPASAAGGMRTHERDPLAERREHRLDRRPRLAVADQHQAPGQVGQPCERLGEHAVGLALDVGAHHRDRQQRRDLRRNRGASRQRTGPRPGTAETAAAARSGPAARRPGRSCSVIASTRSACPIAARLAA